jgi:sugar/nucleoside kinase (ribokinase family)
MTRKQTQNHRERRPIVVGTGLIALDVVVSQTSGSTTRYFAGGTCGNVLAILAFLGWDAFPLARTNGDFTSQWVRDDLAHFGVHKDYLCLKPTGPVPAIIEWIGAKKDGTPSHRYSFVCPTCGSRKPGHKPVLARAVKAVLPTLSIPDAFFSDRVSRAALLLAKHFRAKGSLIVFEPSGVGDPNLFSEALALTHVLKYSTDRLDDSVGKRSRNTLLLEIETLGEQGLRFRSRLPAFQTRGWKHLDAFPVNKLRDAAGSGDWLTAALLNRIGRLGTKGFKQTTEKSLHDAILFAQAAASWKCGFEAPRGGMYCTDSNQFKDEVHAIVVGKTPEPLAAKSRPFNGQTISVDGACLHCQVTRPHGVHVSTH